MKESKCRNCGNILDANTAIGEVDKLPDEGDLSVCAYCGTISQFDRELNLIPLEPEDLVKLNDDDRESFDQLMKVRRVITQNLHPKQ